MPQRADKFWTIFLTTVLVDVTSKRFAVSELSPPYLPHSIIDDVLRFTIAYNPEGAMSFSLGPSSRWWFVLLSMGTLFVLGYMYNQTPREDRIQIASIALICGGAVGNLLDRIRSSRGVVNEVDNSTRRAGTVEQDSNRAAANKSDRRNLGVVPARARGVEIPTRT